MYTAAGCGFGENGSHGLWDPRTASHKEVEGDVDERVWNREVGDKRDACTNTIGPLH